MTDSNLREIEILAMHNGTVAAIYDRLLRGHCSEEDALVHMVHNLAKQYDELLDLSLKHFLICPAPNILKIQEPE